MARDGGESALNDGHNADGARRVPNIVTWSRDTALHRDPTRRSSFFSRSLSPGLVKIAEKVSRADRPFLSFLADRARVLN